MFHHLCASLEGAVGQVLWDIGPRVTTVDIVCLLQTRFGTQLQVEHLKVTLAYPSAESLLITHVGKETKGKQNTKSKTTLSKH